MENNEIISKLLEKAKNNNLRILIISKEGERIFTSEGHIVDFDSEVVHFYDNKVNSEEVIDRGAIIKLKILNGEE